MNLKNEEQVALLEERAISLSMSDTPRLAELITLKDDVKQLRRDTPKTDPMIKRLDSVICDCIATLQKWIDNAPNRVAA